jgi:hypothetical protein
MATKDERGRQNQSEFRYANGRLMDALVRASHGNLDGRLIGFFCECANPLCRGRVAITAGRYDDLHLDDRDYVILPGHLRVAGEEIVERNEYYEVVKKAA